MSSLAPTLLARSLIKIRPPLLQFKRFKGDPNFKPAHMNELPIPCGPWDPPYKKKQKKYTLVLIVGVVWFLFSFNLCKASGALFFNWGPPERPGPPLIESEQDCASPCPKKSLRPC